MKILNNLLDNPTIWSVTDSVLDIFGEFGRSAKKTRKLKLDVYVMGQNAQFEIYRGLVNETEEILYVPMLNRMWINPVFYYTGKKRIVFVSMLNHQTLDLKFLSGVADAQKYSVLMSFKYMRKWVTLNLKEVRGCIDMSIFDNVQSPEFMVDSSKIIKTKTFEFLMDVPKRKLIMYCTITGLIGSILGAIGFAILLYGVIYLTGQ